MESSQTYGLTEWREDLKRLLLGSGLDGKHTAFVFTDSQLRHEAFLEDINSLLNTGEVRACGSSPLPGLGLGLGLK